MKSRFRNCHVPGHLTDGTFSGIVLGSGGPKIGTIPMCLLNASAQACKTAAQGRSGQHGQSSGLLPYGSG
jgi:hypothetical protein